MAAVPSPSARCCNISISVAFSGWHNAIQVSALHAELNKDFSGTLARVAALGYREIQLVWWNVSRARRLHIPRPQQSNRIGSGKKGKPGSLSQGPPGFLLFLEEFHCVSPTVCPA